MNYKRLLKRINLKKGKYLLTTFIIYMLLPFFIYFLSFCVLTFPLITKFSSHIFADAHDGLQTYWNIWWVNKAITDLHQSPWHTNYLHFPYGISLISHNLNAFNGFLGVFLSKFFSFIEIYNIAVIFSFIVGGLTSFLLCFKITKSHISSLITGYIFTFSNYHFAHAEGHLPMVSLEWIPLFILCWLRYLERPTIYRSLFAALALFLVILCDYYYFVYCVLTGLIMFIFFLKSKNKYPSFFSVKQIILSIFFIIIVLLTSGTLFLSLLSLNNKDPIIGAHPEEIFSLDLASLFIPGGHWYFFNLTKFFWSQLPGNIHESSVYVGWSVIYMVIYVWINRKIIHNYFLRLIYYSLGFFVILSLGPIFHFWGKTYPAIPMPYAYFNLIIPGFNISGLPVRMMVMVTLFTAIIFGLGLKKLFKKKGKSRVIGISLILLLLIEYLPRPMAATKLEIPEYTSYLKAIPNQEAILDLVSNPYSSLYFQTIHQKPLPFGYLARTPLSVYKKDLELQRLLASKDYCVIHQNFHFRYLLTTEKWEDSMLIFNKDGSKIYDLNNCK